MPFSATPEHLKDDTASAVVILDTLLYSFENPMRFIGERIVAEIARDLQPIRKADLDLTTPEGFAEWTMRLALDLRVSDAYAIERSVNRLRPILQANWAKLTTKEIDETLDEVVDYVVWLRQQILRLQEPILETAAKSALMDSMADYSKKYGFMPAPIFSKIDDAEARFLRDSTVNFMRLRDRTISEEFSKRARQIVSDGLSHGYSGPTIGKKLQEAFGNVQSPAYYLLIANQFLSRASAWGALRSYQSAGVNLAEFAAIMDERTCEICRFFDGKIIVVDQALESMTAAEADPDPERVKYLNPWIKEGKDDDGQFFYINRPGGKRILLGRVEQPGAGTHQAGSYRDLMEMSDMQALGIGPPPLHGNCRCTLLPV